MLLTLFGRLIQFALVFASVRIMTQLLSPSDVGRVALLTTTTSLFALFLVNPVGMFFNRRLHPWVNDGVARARFHLFVIYLVAVAAVAAGALWLGDHLGVDLGGVSLDWAIVLVCGSLCFNTAVQTLVPSLNMVGRPRPFILLTLACLMMGLGASIALTRWAGASAEHWLGGTLLAQALFSAIAYGVFFGKSSPQSPRPTPLDAVKMRQMADFCWPIAIAVLLQWAHMQGYRFLLADEFGLAHLGLFAAGYGLAASLMSAAETILTTWFQPQFYRDISADSPERRDRAWPEYARVMVPASLLAVTALIAAAPSLPSIMLGPAFQDAGEYVMLGALAEWARMMVGMISLNAHRHMSTRALILPNVLGAAATYVAFYALLRWLGMLAAPLAVFLGGITIVAYLYRVTFANDAHASIDFRALLAQTLVLAPTAVLFVGGQTWLLTLDIRGLPWIVCLAVGAVWGLLAWRLLNPIMMNQTRYP
jgi:O-antigen/teichoic acid export membrane protein